MGRKRFTTEKFIELAKKANGNKYDYSLAKYEDMHSKVKIVCLLHGEFETTPEAHINKKKGCRACGYIAVGLANKLTFKEFEERSNEIHNSFFKYKKSGFANAREDAIIICPVHGEFKQKAYSHMIGFGCKKCSLKRRFGK